MKTPKTKSRSSQQRMVKRFSDKQAELAAKISNDIAEDIDCGESRKTLRMAVSYFADVACVESQRRRAAESKLELFRCAKGIMDAVLPPNDQAHRSAHSGDCTIYASVINSTPLDGICTCGYGWESVRRGDWDKMFSAEWLEANKRPNER